VHNNNQIDNGDEGENGFGKMNGEDQDGE